MPCVFMLSLCLGPLPEPDMMASGARLSQVQPWRLIVVVLDGLSEMELACPK